MRYQGAVLAIVAVVGLSCARAERPQRPGLAACDEPPIPAEALCGTHEVFENRAAGTGRKIPLRIVVLPATGRDRLPDPFTYFAGGPGEASIPVGLFQAEQLGSLRQARDVLLVDLRGTGQSGGLFCKELAGMAVQEFLDEFLPAARVRACRDRLQREADLSWYTTDAAVDDVEDVRIALGYGPLNLMGGSYGTRAVLTYLRRHPQSVRTATLDGVLAPDARYLVTMPRATQDALDGLIAECAADPACRGAFPQLREELDAVLDSATAEPVVVTLVAPGTRRPIEIRLSRSGVAQILRNMLYSPVGAALVPLHVHLAAQGDWKPLAWTALAEGLAMTSEAVGFYQSVMCAEDVASIREEEIAPAVAGTFLGDFRLRRQQAACEGWPTRDPGPDLEAPVVSDVPALLISGERDPATPAASGERVAQSLARARHLVVADGSHSRLGMSDEGCVDRLIAAFIEAGTAEGLDTSCLTRMRRPEFELPEVAVARADLERLAGSYAANEAGWLVAVDLKGDHLRLSVKEGLSRLPPSLLSPTSPTRFRWAGPGLAPGLAVVFQVTGGKATALLVVQPGMKEGVTMERLE